MNELNVDKFYNAFKDKSYATVNIYSHYMYNADIESERMLLEPVGGGYVYTKAIQSLSTFIEKIKKEWEKISDNIYEKNVLYVMTSFPNFEGEVAMFNTEDVEIDTAESKNFYNGYRANPFNIVLDNYIKNPKPVYTYKLTFKKACIYELLNDVVIYGDCLKECVAVFADYLFMIHDYFENNKIDDNIDDVIDDITEDILKNGKE